MRVCRTEGLVIWASKPWEWGLLVWSSKLDVDGSMVWASKPSVVYLTSLGLKTGEWQIGGHVVASRILHQCKSKSRRCHVNCFVKEKLEWICHRGYLDEFFI